MISLLKQTVAILGLLTTANLIADETYSFKDKPLLIKGSGSCEGVDYADLDGDGIMDIISGIPDGFIHFYKGITPGKGAEKNLLPK